MTVDFVNKYLEQKIEENEEYIVCSYFDLRVNNNVPDNEICEFQYFAKNKLSNMRYNVFFKGEKYIYNGVLNTVKDNQVLIAIKEKRG